MTKKEDDKQRAEKARPKNASSIAKEEKKSRERQ